MMKPFILLTVVIGFLSANSGFVRGQEAYIKESSETSLQGRSGAKAFIAEIDQSVSAKEKAPSEQSERPSEDKVIAAEPVMEIKRIDSDEPLYSFELRDTPLADLFRVLAHDYKLNLLVDKEVTGSVTASLSNISLEEALETIAGSQNLILNRNKNVIRVRPNFITKIFTIKYLEAKQLLGGSGNPASSKNNQVSSGEGKQSAEEATIYILLSDKGKILSGALPNSIIVIDYPSNIEKIEEYLNAVDQKLSRRAFRLKYLRAAEVAGSQGSSQNNGGENQNDLSESSSSGNNSDANVPAAESGSSYSGGV